MKEEKASSLSISSSSWAGEREERSGERTPHAEQRYLQSPEEWPREDWEGLSKLQLQPPNLIAEPAGNMRRERWIFQHLHKQMTVISNPVP